MKILIENKMYVQKKDLDLIFKTCDVEDIPDNLINEYNKHKEKTDFSFITFFDNNTIDFINDFWFIIDYKDFADLTYLDYTDFYISDLNKLRAKRIEYDKHKFLDDKKEYNSWLEEALHDMKYVFYIPKREELKNYPLDFQLLYNKVIDIIDLRNYNCGSSKLKLPKEIIKPVYYSKKQLQQIYYEVLSDNLSFEELKPYKEQLYSIFSKIDYSPDILEMIRKIILLHKYNTVDFINDELLDILLHVEGKKTKFQESTMFLIDYLYAIGYNNFENFESKIILENDLKIVKKIIDFIGRVNLEDKYIEQLSKYNYVLANIILAMKKSDYSFRNPYYINDIFLNILVYIYFRPNVINYNFDFIPEVYNYINDNHIDIANYIDYDLNSRDIYKQHFIKYFNGANNLLINLYNKKYNQENAKKLIKEK